MATNKLKYTFDDYINSPSGRGSATLPVAREAIHNEFSKKLTSLESSKGKITYTGVKSGDGKVYYIHFKIPSDSTNNFFYDTVVEFTKTSSDDIGLKNRRVKFFSNDPNFIYTYAYSFKSHGLLIPGLEKKLPYKSLTQRASTRNPDNSMGYARNIYFAYLVMERDNLFDKQVVDRICKVGSVSLINSKIQHFDRRETERKALDSKSRDGENKLAGPRHSKLLKSKNIASDSSKSLSPVITKNTSRTKKVSSKNKLTKTSKTVKKI